MLKTRIRYKGRGSFSLNLALNICPLMSKFIPISDWDIVFKCLQLSSGAVSPRCYSWAGDWRGAGAAMCRMCPECCAVLSLSSVDRVGSRCHKPARTARAFTNDKTLTLLPQIRCTIRISPHACYVHCTSDSELEPIFTKFFPILHILPLSV